MGVRLELCSRVFLLRPQVLDAVGPANDIDLARFPHHQDGRSRAAAVMGGRFDLVATRVENRDQVTRAGRRGKFEKAGPLNELIGQQISMSG